jgi:lipopolysaccharide/colanic/teichoic acid biosynthesis glycosyltransferase
MAIALLALVLLGPIIAAICLIITLEDGGPVFFKQIRIGENGKPFSMWKFRSMSVDAEARRASLLAQSDRDATCFKMKRDPRITRIGSIIRRASLDELPQLVNVLKGEMAIVGPRPALPTEVISYKERERGRLLGKPGITCIWQVSGRAEIPFERQVEMDIKYLSRKSITQDIGLIAKTIPAVLTGRGAY